MKANEFDWKTVGDSAYLYRTKDGRVAGFIEPGFSNALDSTFAAYTEDGDKIGLYVNLAYAKTALLQAITSPLIKSGK